MSDDINIEISATDKATATIRALQAQLSSLSTSIKNISSLTLAGIGVQQVGSFLAGSLKEYAEAEKSQGRLQSVLKATGNTTKLTFAEISSFTDSLEKTTGTSGESLNDAAANLSRFANITGDQFKEVLTLANDMSAVLGTDVTGNVQLLAKALNSPAEGLSRLSRLGVSFNEVQKQQIEMLDQVGEKAEAQAEILDEIRRQFGGAGADFGKTTAGQLEILSANISDLKKAIGETLAGAILPLIKSITGRDGMTLADKAIAASGVEVRADKVSERADLEKQIAELDSRVRQLQAENLDSQQGLVSSLFGRGRRLGQEKIDELRAVARLRMSQLQGIDATATAQSAGQAQAARMQAANRQQNMAFFGNIAQGAAGGAANGLAEANAEDVGAAIGAQVRGMFFGQNWWQKQQQQQRDQSLAATESRFLTRGRGVMTEADRKNLEEQRKQTEYLKRIEKAFANFTSGENLLFVEGVN